MPTKQAKKSATSKVLSLFNPTYHLSSSKGGKSISEINNETTSSSSKQQSDQVAMEQIDVRDANLIVEEEAGMANLDVIFSSSSTENNQQKNNAVKRLFFKKSKKKSKRFF
jgi:hypothetical protein